MQGPLIGVLALQGAFEEHQKCLEAIGCRTVQVRTPQDLDGLDGIVLPGGESTAIGLIGTSTSSGDGDKDNLWKSLREFSATRPTWGTCAGMILLAEKCVGTSAVIEDGQSLIGGIDIAVCRNYFGSQVSSFEMDTPAPPSGTADAPPPSSSEAANSKAFPGVFIRAPAILSAGEGVEVLGRVFATPCRQAAVTLRELERKIAAGENVLTVGVVDALDRSGADNRLEYIVVVKRPSDAAAAGDKAEEEKKDGTADAADDPRTLLVLPGAAEGSNAREVICAARKDNLLCTAFHPELTDDHRWHEYFLRMVREAKSS